MAKKYLLDTNVLLNSLDTLRGIIDRGDKVIIPLQVLEELDKMKGRGHDEERKFKARVVLRELEKYEEVIEMVSDLNYDTVGKMHERNFDMNYQDNRILALKTLAEHKAILLTMDKSMRFKARALGINVELVNKVDTKDKDYSGKITVESNSMAQVRFKSDGFVLPEDLDLKEKDLYPNQIVKMKTFSGYDVGRYIKSEGKIRRLIHKATEVSNITALNIEQQMALDVLNDPKVKVITLSGRAGTGKTLIALAWALEEIRNSGRYDRLLLGKNTAPIDKWSYQGFTKGETTDKLLSHFGNYTSNLEFLANSNYKNMNESMDGKKELEKLMDDGDVDVLDISSILGSSIDRKIVLIDEAQSFDVEAMKSIITRVTDGSKLIIIGDLRQETVNKLQHGNCGFQEIINQLKGCESVAHITLKNIERGKIQREIAEALNL